MDIRLSLCNGGIREEKIKNRRKTMVKNIVKGERIFSKKAQPATEADKQVITDLLDTLKANKNVCVGMAANMIGILKNIIAINDNGDYLLMYNPEIIKSDGAYETEEGCLSLDGLRKTKRYKKIKVRYLDRNFKIKIKTYEGFTAQIIQHETDHLSGIII